MPGVRDNQREGHPGAAPFGSVRTGRAFRQGFLPWRKGIGIHANVPAGPDRPVLTAAQGPHARVARTFLKSKS
jgi:hypothetical protein